MPAGRKSRGNNNPLDRVSGPTRKRADFHMVINTKENVKRNL